MVIRAHLCTYVCHECLPLSHHFRRNFYFTDSFFKIMLITIFSPPPIIWYVNNCDKNYDLFFYVVLDFILFYYVLGQCLECFFPIIVRFNVINSSILFSFLFSFVFSQAGGIYATTCEAKNS